MSGCEHYAVCWRQSELICTFFLWFFKITFPHSRYCNCICTRLLVLFSNNFLVILLSCLYCHFKIIISIVFFFYFPQIWVGTKDGTIFIYKPENRELWKKIKAHDDAVRAMCTAEERYVISGSGSKDGKVAIWSPLAYSMELSNPSIHGE